MSKQVRKAVFPAGGLGTRFLPATKVIPKEMLALVDKPVIQYGVEEAIASGIEHIIIITGRGKGTIEDHFDHSFELDATLELRGRHELLAVSRGVSSLARISYVRQKEPLGLGHAVLCAKDVVGDEPFAVILPDDVIESEAPCLLTGRWYRAFPTAGPPATCRSPGISCPWSAYKSQAARCRRCYDPRDAEWR